MIGCCSCAEGVALGNDSQAHGTISEYVQPSQASQPVYPELRDRVEWHSLPPAPQGPIECNAFSEWALPGDTRWAELFRIGSHYLLRFPKYADFTISGDGYRVSCTATPEASITSVLHLFLNQVLPLALSRQGELVFHASAIGTNTGAAAFLGPSGRGKSTLAASFATSGIGFLTDDLLVAQQEFSDSRYSVAPSQRSVRLWADSGEAVIPHSLKADPRVQFTSKDRFAEGPELLFCASPSALNRAYVLGNSATSSVTISSMSKADAFDSWLKNSFSLDREDATATARQFDRIAHLADSIPIFHLNYPRDYDYLPRVRAAILTHLGV